MTDFFAACRASVCGILQAYYKVIASLCLEKHSGTYWVVTVGLRLQEISDGSPWKTQVLKLCSKNEAKLSPFIRAGESCYIRTFGINTSLFFLLEACNETCSACTNGFECSLCQTSLLMKNGQCVTSCGKGYFQDQLLCTGNSKQKKNPRNSRQKLCPSY